MQQENRQGETLLSAVTSLVAGGAIALALSLLTLAAGAWMISQGSLDADWIGRAGVLGSFLGCLVGGRYAISGIRSRALLVGLGVGGLYCLLWMLCGLLFWEEGSGMAFSGAAAALLGGGSGGILSAARKKRRK